MDVVTARLKSKSQFAITLYGRGWKRCVREGLSGIHDLRFCLDKIYSDERGEKKREGEKRETAREREKNYIKSYRYIEIERERVCVWVWVVVRKREHMFICMKMHIYHFCKKSYTCRQAAFWHMIVLYKNWYKSYVTCKSNILIFPKKRTSLFSSELICYVPSI